MRSMTRRWYDNCNGWGIWKSMMLKVLTTREKGSLAMSRSVVRWYRRISLSAFTPGLYRCLCRLRGPGSLATRIQKDIVSECHPSN